MWVWYVTRSKILHEKHKHIPHRGSVNGTNLRNLNDSFVSILQQEILRYEGLGTSKTGANVPLQPCES